MKNAFRLICQLLSRVSDIVHKISLFLSSFILIAMLVIAALGVIFRFLLHASLSWNEEIDGYLFVWLTCLGASIGYKYRAHPAVEIFVTRFPPLLRKVAYSVADLIVLVLGVLLTMSGQQMVVLLGNETASSLQFLSMGYAYAAIPAGGLCLIIHSISHIAKNWVELNELYGDVERKGDVVWEH